MPTPKATEVRTAFRELLLAITGDYTPDAVIWYPFSSNVLSSGHRTVIALALDVKENETQQSTTYGMIGVEMPIDIAVCTRYEEAADLDPFTEVAKRREDVQDELEQVVLNQIRGDKKLMLGGTTPVSIHITVPDTDQSYENTWVQGWAVVFLRATVQYQHEETSA